MVPFEYLKKKSVFSSGDTIRCRKDNPKTGGDVCGPRTSERLKPGSTGSLGSDVRTEDPSETGKVAAGTSRRRTSPGQADSGAGAQLCQSSAKCS